MGTGVVGAAVSITVGGEVLAIDDELRGKKAEGDAILRRLGEHWYLTVEAFSESL